MKWNTDALEVNLHQKTWIQNKVCVHTDTCTGTEITWEVPKLILIFRALSRRTGWKQLSTNLSCHLDKCDWVKCHWFGRFCISFTAGLCPALKPICKDLSNCLTTFQGGRQKCFRLGFHPQGMNACSDFAILMKCYHLTWNWGSPLNLHNRGKKSRKQYFSPSKYEIVTLKSEKIT